MSRANMKLVRFFLITAAVAIGAGVVAGVLVFGDAPDGITLLGMVVIAVSGLVVAASGKDRKA